MFRMKAYAHACLFLLVVLAAAAAPAQLAAQGGSITGTVTDSAQHPLSGAQVLLGATGRRVVTNDAGAFALREVAAGSYRLDVRLIGRHPESITAVVQAGKETQVKVILTTSPIELEPLVASASRRIEKVTEAPAEVTRIDASMIATTVGNSFAPALKNVVGVDFIQTGILAAGINARGFNSAFNNRVLQLEDGRIAALPEAGLPLGQLTTIPKIDLGSVEVLIGPGSALYGPDASSGVVTLSTKDPKQFSGTSFEIAGGGREFFDLQARQAGVFGQGRWGYKLSGEYESAFDFTNQNIYAPLVTNGPVSPEVGANFSTNVLRGEGALVYYFEGDGRLEFNAGGSKSNSMGNTNLGRNQIVDWKYGHQQLRFTSDHWYAQAYRVESNSGQTYQLNAFAQNRLKYTTISDDSVRALSAFPDAASIMAGEIQNNFSIAALNGTHITYGAQIRHDDVNSHGVWLVDRQTGQDVVSDQKGAYGQIEVPVTSALKLVGAARYDKHDFYEAEWSPKAAVLISPATDQTFRVTYNRAFKSPSILMTSFYYPDFAPSVGVFGNRDGFLIKDNTGTVTRTIDPIRPETNTTWEVGYKGILGGKLYIDATGYFTSIADFQSPLSVIANPFAGSTAYDAVTGTKITNAAGGAQVALAYFNVGKAKMHGLDLGLRYLVSPTVSISGTMNAQSVDTIEAKATDPAEATSFNSPTFKATVGMDFARITPALRGGFSLRQVNGYNFISGVNNGFIPSFTTLDLGLGLDMPSMNGRFNLSVQNLFSCTSGTTAANGWIASGRPEIYTASHSCGVGKKHVEFLNTPQIGTMVFLGFRYGV